MTVTRFPTQTTYPANVSGFAEYPKKLVNWASVFPSTIFSIQSNVGTSTGSTFTMADTSGNGKNFTATLAAMPTVGSGPNGLPEVIFDGVNQVITCSGLNLPAPGTTPFFLFLVFRHITFVGTNPVVCGNAAASARHLLYGVGGSPRLSSFNGVESAIPASPPAIGSYECTELYRSNSTSDYLRRGSGAAASGINTGNLASTGFSFGGAGVLTKSNIGLLAAVGCSALPSAGQIAEARALVTAMYGSNVQV